MQNIPKLKAVCVNCMLNSRIHQYPETASEEKKVEYMIRVLKELSEMKNTHGPTLATRNVIRIQKEMFGCDQDYSELKHRFNQLILEKEAYLYEQIHQAADPLKLAVQFSIVGNLIDFIVMDGVNEDQLEQMFVEASEYIFDEKIYTRLKNDVLNARNIVVLHDNCGEIVIDKLLIQILKQLNPSVHIMSVVRGDEIMNDATMIDAVQVGLTNVVDVIGNGTDIPGTCLQYLSNDVINILEKADVILSKGQGNFETMQGCDMNIYYIFLCKCDMIAEMFGVPKFTPMLVNENI